MHSSYSGLVLASASPRRHQLLAYLGLSFEVVVPDVDETPLVEEAAADMVARLAREKALKVLEKFASATVLAADTAVVLGAEALGKPRDVAEARSMLQKLSGREHQVITGIAVASGARCVQQVCSTLVRFKRCSPDQIDRYVELGESLDKAGAYGIQGAGVQFIESLNGSYSNVVGLDLVVVGKLLEGFSVNSCL